VLNSVAFLLHLGSKIIKENMTLNSISFVVKIYKKEVIMKSLVIMVGLVCVMVCLISPNHAAAQTSPGPGAGVAPRTLIGTPVAVRWDINGDCIITFEDGSNWLVEAYKHQWQFRINQAISEGGDWIFEYVVIDGIEWLMDIYRPPWYGPGIIRPGNG
jgi:hypothetical protein